MLGFITSTPVSSISSILFSFFNQCRPISVENSLTLLSPLFDISMIYKSNDECDKIYAKFFCTSFETVNFSIFSSMSSGFIRNLDAIDGVPVSGLKSN